MAPAKRIRGIKPKSSFQQNGARIIEARLEELLAWRSSIGDPANVAELHNMRISAKRLRYALEIFALCFPELKPAQKDLTDMQETLGTIHDLDVLTEILRGRLRDLDARVQSDAIEAASGAESNRQRSDHLRAVLYASARNPIRLGLFGLLAEKLAERERDYKEFLVRWDGAGLDLLARTIRDALAPQRQPVGGDLPADPTEDAES